MRRFLPGAVLAILVGSTVVIAQSVEPANVENCVYVVEHDKVLCDLIDVTTTTQATTTTTAPTTTTTTVDTTTTSVPGLVIPPTEPYPARGTVPYKDCGGFDIIARNAEAGIVWWTAPYWCADGLPYTDGATWLDGDREGYRCAYGFITDGTGEDIVGRFAFVRPPDALYAAVNDEYMAEAQRYLDGTPVTNSDGNEIPDEDCTDVLSDIDYEGACRNVDERPRIGFFDSEGNVLDIRDYTNTDANNVVFNLHSVSEDRVTVIACEDGLVGMIVYYDSMGDGQIAAELNE